MADLKTKLKQTASDISKNIIAETKDAIIGATDSGVQVAGIPIPVSKKDSSICEMATFKDPSVYLVFDKEGNVSTRKRKDILDEPSCNLTSRTGSTVEYTLPLQVGGLKEVTLGFGLIVVSGGTGTGKTSFIRSLSKVIKVNRVLAVEPADSYEELSTIPMRYSADAAIAYLVQQFIRGNKALPVLDSLREPLFETDGSAADKGIINAFFTRVTKVSNALAQNGVTMLATINPLGDSPDFLKQFYLRLTSATPGYIILQSVEGPQDNLTYRGVVAMRPDRVERPFQLNVKIGQTPASPDAEEVSFKMSEEHSDDHSSIADRTAARTISHTA